MMKKLRDAGPHTIPFNGKAPLRKVYTGIGPLDYQLTVLSLFFYNLVDGSHPQACLQAYHFASQFASGWMILMMESLREGNRGRTISFIGLWGMGMQLVTFAVVAPVYFAIHLSTSPTVSSRKWSDLRINSPQLQTIPYSVALGYILPAILLALPAPSVIGYDAKQLFMAVWQVFPLTVGFLQLAAPSVRSWFIVKVSANEKTDNRTVIPMRKIYALMLAIAVVGQVSSWTISISAVFFPRIFTSEMSGLLKPSSVFLPPAVTPAVKMPSIAAASSQLLQYDEIVGSAAMVLWSAALYINAMDRTRRVGWVSLMMKGAAIGTLAGPLGLAVAAVWARDEMIFARDNESKKGK
ncbi:MAG: hypothetical protein Q9168_005200 [Polycauliona sp. 1 TL-2023]